MMKKYWIMAVLVLAIGTANAQVLISLLLGDKLNSGKIEFGLEGGVNWSSIKNLEQSKSMRTFNLGFYFDIKLKNPSLMLNTGVIVKSAMGAEELPVYSLGNNQLDSVFKEGNVSRTINYFNVPVMLKYSFKNHFFVKSGIQLGLRYNAHDEFKNSVQESDDLSYKLKTKSQFHALDAGLAAGIGYRLMKGNGMNIGLEYYYGLVNITTNASLPKQYNRVLYITAGIPIGKGKINKEAK